MIWSKGAQSKLYSLYLPAAHRALTSAALDRRIPDLLIRDETENERMSLIQAEEQRQNTIRMDNMVQYNENLIAERYEDVKSIEQDVMEINEIFRDLAVMVDDQGEKMGTRSPPVTGSCLSFLPLSKPLLLAGTRARWAIATLELIWWGGGPTDKISDYIQSTADNTEAASEEVDGAYEAQQKAR